MSETNANRPVIVPCLRYQNCLDAIDWLCRAFGFERHAVYSDDSGIVHHAQLTFRGGMVMLGSVVETPFGEFLKQPREIGGFETQAPYVIVPDADDHYHRACAAGAEIVIDLKTEDYGGRGYSCRDIEGHLWCFGTYDPSTA